MPALVGRAPYCALRIDRVIARTKAHSNLRVRRRTDVSTRGEVACRHSLHVARSCSDTSFVTARRKSNAETAQDQANPQRVHSIGDQVKAYLYASVQAFARCNCLAEHYCR